MIIMYRTEDGLTGLITPSKIWLKENGESVVSLSTLASKNLPKEVPFKIVARSAVPEDRVYPTGDV